MKKEEKNRGFHGDGEETSSTDRLNTTFKASRPTTKTSLFKKCLELLLKKNIKY